MHRAAGRDSDAEQGARPGVSVVVPFTGDRDAAAELREALDRLELGPDDELIVTDNSPGGTFAAAAADSRIAVVRSQHERSSYHSRNVGAERADREWVLFIDADTRPRPDLIDRYFDEPVPASVGAIAGPMLPLRETDTVFSRYAESRTLNEQLAHVRNHYRPFGATANLLVRRAAFDELGGFYEGVRSGEDADFCWRLGREGWEIAYRPDAYVKHLLRERLRPYLRVHARYTSGRRWLMRRWPDSAMGPRLRRIFRFGAGMPYWWLRGQFERGLFKGIDVLVVVAEGVGYLFGNRPPAADPDERDRCEIAVMVDRFPEPSETFILNEVRAMQHAGRRVCVEARSRPRRPAFGANWGIDVRYAEDVGTLGRLADLLWLLGRHPIRSFADLLARRRWRREEEVSALRVLAPTVGRLRRGPARHLHVHFARRSALDALRIQRLIRVPYSVTAHAWEIYKQPTNLKEKLERASFVTTGCDYNVRHLRELVGEPATARIHRIVMGVDGDSFARRVPYDGDGTVIAVGRLVEKKGFDQLVAATALADSELIRRVVIVGDGRLRGELSRRAEELGVADRVELVGSKPPEDVRRLLERSALLAMPSLVAPDGDRDSMPVVVKEALAMGVPVVASQEVGLPEVVRDEWGRLVKPGDPESLAAAMQELLRLPAEERRRMGARGREFVVGEFSVEAETAKLLSLIDSAANEPPGAR